MNISRMLLSPQVCRLKDEGIVLEGRLTEPVSEEQRELAVAVRRNLRRIEKLEAMVASAAEELQKMDLGLLYVSFRDLKRQMRIAERKYQRMQLEAALYGSRQEEFAA